jgi:regulator of replication initiation timing
VQSILKHLKSMEAKMHALLAEMQELKYDIRHMEQENDRLRQELAACYSKIAIDDPDAGTAGKTGVAFSNLLELYDQDFHICNLYFGHSYRITSLNSEIIFQKVSNFNFIVNNQNCRFYQGFALPHAS